MASLTPDREPDLVFSEESLGPDGEPVSVLSEEWVWFGRQRSGRRPTKMPGIEWRITRDIIILFLDPNLPFDFAAEVAWSPDPYISRLEVRSRRDAHSAEAPGITTTHLRELPVSQRVFAVVAALAEQSAGQDLTPAQVDTLARITARHARGTPLLEQIAELYRQAVVAGDRAPTATVADQLDYSRSHTARLVSQARKAELLGPASGSDQL